MQPHTRRVLLVALSAALLGSLAHSGLLLRAHSAYKREQPPISKHVTGRCKERGLVGHWTLDALSDEVAQDRSGRGNHAAVAYALGPLTKYRAGPPRLVDGKRGKALEVYGKQWLSGGNNDCFASEQLTVAAWVYQEDETSTVPTIAAKSAWPFNGWWLCSTSSSVQPGRDRYIDFGIAWGNGYTHVESGYQLPLREWHHIVASLDNERGEAEFFVDGERFGPVHQGVPKWLVNWDHDLFIGDYDGSGRWPWKGRLDDVRYYNRVLREDEVRALFAGAPYAERASARADRTAR